MFKKLAKLKYLPNKVSEKKIKLEELNYWSVNLQEPYFSYMEASKKSGK